MKQERAQTLSVYLRGTSRASAERPGAGTGRRRMRASSLGSAMAFAFAGRVRGGWLNAKILTVSAS